MEFTAFDNMPDDAQVWVYGLDCPLNADTRSRVSAALGEFVTTWKSHEDPVTGAYTIAEDRFIVLGGYCTDGISGCSTDGSVNLIKALQEHIGVNALDRSLVFYRSDDNTVAALSRADFQKEVAAGTLGKGTTVFDTTIHRVSDIRAGKFETLFENCWHAKAFAK